MELLEAALDSLPDGVGLWGREGEVKFWNQAAQDITGYTALELVGHETPAALERLVEKVGALENREGPGAHPDHYRFVAQVQHKFGHNVPVIANLLVLGNGMGERIGSAVLFHPVESQDALPQSELSDSPDLKGARADLLERLQIEFDDFCRGGAPLGVVRIAVDQAHELRNTHGEAACHAMLEKVYYALAHGLRPGEEIGYWSSEGFLVIAHERNAEMLVGHAKTLVGLARTADFRWWGDRVSLTASVGAAQASSDAGETLTHILDRADEALEISIRDGGNRATLLSANHPTNASPEDLPCSPS